MATKAILTKLSDNENALRSNDIEGEFEFPPTLKEYFNFYAEAFDPELRALGAMRHISTNTVKSVRKTKIGYKFTTLSGSVYRLRIVSGPQTKIGIK